MGIIAVPLVSTLFQHGQFGAQDVMMTRTALVAYAIGLAGIILVKVLAPGYYARQNVKTPVRIAVFTLCVTQVLNLVFVPWLQHAGLALSIGLGACLNAGMLFYFLRRGGVFQPQAGWLTFLLKLAVALYMMGGALWWLSGSDLQWLGYGTFEKCARLAFLVMAGATVYFTSLWAMGFRPGDFSRRLEP